MCACVVTSDRDLGPGELEKVSLMVKAASEARPASESTTLIWCRSLKFSTACKAGGGGGSRYKVFFTNTRHCASVSRWH